MLFNFKLLSCIDIEEARKFYLKILDILPKNALFEKFIEYFESNWFPLNDNNETRFDFELWSYKNKFNFKGNKKSIIKQGENENYILFSNNAVDSFNHLMNKIIEANNKVSISKFEDLLKFIFIRMSSKHRNDNKERYQEKRLVSDLLRELLEKGYGKNKRLLLKIVKLMKIVMMNK